MREKAKKDIQNRINILEWVSVVVAVIIALIFATVAFSQYSSESLQNVEERNETYIKEFTEELAVKLNEKFTTAQNSVNAVAEMVADGLITDDDVQNMLLDLEAETQFDHVRFVDTSGISHTSEGKTADVSDRKYFIEGMKGNSGSTFITDSRLTNQRQIGFYAPISDNGEVRGVIVAFFDEDTLKSSLEYNFYGVKSSAGIITTEGKTVICSPSETLQVLFDNGLSQNICDFIQTDYFDDESRAAITEAYTERKSTAFDMTYNGLSTIGYIVPLQLPDLSVCMTFPQEASEAMFESGMSAGRKLQSKLIIAFICLAGYLVVLGAERILREKRKSHRLDEKANTDELTGLFNRRAFEKRFEQYEGEQLPEKLVYISLDVNGLKRVNDSLGHAAGDELITGAADCLKESFGAYGDIYRVGGDEFTALILADDEQLEKAKEMLETTTAGWSGKLVGKLSISAGYVRAGDVDPATIKEMSLLADRRMYQSKSDYYKKSGIDRRR